MPVTETVVTTIFAPTPLMSQPCKQTIARRFPGGVPQLSLVTRPREITRCHRVLTCPRDMSSLQLLWQQHLQNVRATCCEDFWTFFLPLHHLSRTAIDTALKSARATFQHDFNRFPLSTRTLFKKIQVSPFWTNVMHSVKIDLSEFQVPAHKRSLKFEFVDPVWAWIQAACLQPPQEMHWEPQTQFMRGHPDHPCYGGGLQYGEAFAQATKSCPPGKSQV